VLPFELMSIDKPFGKLILSGINAFMIASLSDWFEKFNSMVAVISRSGCEFGI
jgi:hypothetical protein